MHIVRVAEEQVSRRTNVSARQNQSLKCIYVRDRTSFFFFCTTFHTHSSVVRRRLFARNGNFPLLALVNRYRRPTHHRWYRLSIRYIVTREEPRACVAMSAFSPTMRERAREKDKKKITRVKCVQCMWAKRKKKRSQASCKLYNVVWKDWRIFRCCFRISFVSGGPACALSLKREGIKQRWNLMEMVGNRRESSIYMNETKMHRIRMYTYLY